LCSWRTSGIVANQSRAATATATHPVATIVLLTVRDRLTAWVCGPQNPIQEEESKMRKFLALGQA